MLPLHAEPAELKRGPFRTASVIAFAVVAVRLVPPTEEEVSSKSCDISG
jgi:hypothetical protein